MTKPQLFLSALAISAIGISGSLIQSKKMTNPEHRFYTSLMSEQKEENEEKSFAGALEYYKQVRANQITGTITAEDIENATAQANALRAKKATRAFDNLSWEEAGPNNVGGRTRGLLVDKDNPEKLFIGSVGGGVFVSTDNGNTWAKRNGNDSVSSVAAVTIAQAANGDIYYGTGEGNAGFTGGGNSHNEQIIQMGAGIFKSTDGGNSFTRLSSTKPSSFLSASDQWAYVDKIVAHPTDPQKLFAATNGGLKVTTNGGTSWAKPTGLTSVSARFCDVEISSDGNVIVAATTSKIYISTDGGANFAASGTTGLTGTSLRIDVAIAPSNANVIYACVAGTPTTEGIGLTGIFKSTDACQTWSTILQGGSAVTNPLGDQGTYDIAFGVHPTNENMVFCGGQIMLWRYNGSAWETIASSGGNASLGLNIHADMHGVFFNPSNPENMYVICDGGFYRTYNCSATQPIFAEKNKNFATAQCYGIAVNSLGKIVYGLQDNGSGIIGTSSNSSLEAKDLTGGDGMRCVTSDYYPNSIITSIYTGQLNRASDGGLNGGASFARFFDKNIDGPNVTSTQDGIPDDNTGVNGSYWITPMAFKEKKVGNTYKSFLVIGTGSSVWMTQSPLFGNSIWFKISKIGGSYKSLAVSDDGKVVYAGTSVGKVYRLNVPSLFDSEYRYYDTITNHYGSLGFPFSDSITQTEIGSFGRFVTDLSCSKDGESVIVTLGNYANTSYVHRSSNARTGLPATFSDITGNLPKMPVYTSVLVNNNPNKIMIGTELGIYGTDNGGSSWTDLNGMNATNPATWHPRVATYELVEKPVIYNANGSSYHGSIIYSGTHGRGVFRTFSMSNLWPTGVDEYTKDLNKLTVYPNPAQDVASINYPAINSGNVQVTLFSLTGSKVKSFSFNTIAGENKLQMNIADLTKGAYIVVMTNGTTRETSTLLKN